MEIGEIKLTSQTPFIIAEVGSNWKHFQHAKDAVSMAKQCGAEAVKFQLFRHKELYGYAGPILPGEMPIEWLPKLKEKADACGIEFMCSAFSPEGLEIVNEYVNAHKIASCEMLHFPMLDLIKKFGKPTFISTAGYPIADIKGMIDYMRPMENFCVNYCVGKYPANICDINYIAELSEIHPYVGYSDHTTNVIPLPALAAGAGAIAIEKHFNPFDIPDTPDAPHSLGIRDFKLMVKSLRHEAIHTLGMSDPEFRTKHIRRVVAIKDLIAGTILSADNCGLYRCKEIDSAGAHPRFYKKMLGDYLHVDKKQGEGIGVGDMSGA